MALDYSIRMLRRRRQRGRAEAQYPVPFVVGVGRSGTTLLRMMLDSHPDLAIPPETHFLNPLIQASGRLRWNARTAAKVIVSDERRRWNDFGLTEEELVEAFEQVHPFTTTDAVRAFYFLYASKFGKHRWGDKTPDYIRKMKKLQNTIPEARFIHVIRDGRDAGMSQNSRLAKRGKSTIPAREMARRWRKRIVKARLDAELVDHYMEVRYEDLVTDTEATLRRVCEHVDLAFDPAMLRYYERAEERLQEMAGALPAKKGRPEREAGERIAAHALTMKPPQEDRVAAWKTQMDAAENAEFEQAAGYLLNELGYETATPKETWIPPEEWARSKKPGERARGEAGSNRFGASIGAESDQADS